VIAEKRARLEHEIAARNDVQRAKVEAVNRLDSEIERHTQTIVQLEREILDYDKAVDARRNDPSGPSTETPRGTTTC
jgi:hypothetical protein